MLYWCLLIDLTTSLGVQKIFKKEASFFFNLMKFNFLQTFVLPGGRKSDFAISDVKFRNSK